jgi:hypothetical protein
LIQQAGTDAEETVVTQVVPLYYLAIESIHELDMGLGPQLKLDYLPKDHKGFDHVIPTVIRGGRAVPFSDWSVVTTK